MSNNLEGEELRILGVDIGEKRTGFALSDPLGITAQPLPTVQGLSEEQLIKNILDIAIEKEVQEIVIGLPRNMNGTIGKAGSRTMEFVKKLKAQTDCPVTTEDERLTTMMADRALAALGEKPRARKKKLDRMAAQLILQTYLDRKRAAEGGRDT
jgi:putative Holliday junction resolvase